MTGWSIPQANGQLDAHKKSLSVATAFQLIFNITKEITEKTPDNSKEKTRLCHEKIDNITCYSNLPNIRIYSDA